MNVPVFDLHCDTVTKLLGRDFAAKASIRSNDFHIDLERMKKYQGVAQCFAFWLTTDIPLPRGLKPQDIFWRGISWIEIKRWSDRHAPAMISGRILKTV